MVRAEPQRVRALARGLLVLAFVILWGSPALAKPPVCDKAGAQALVDEAKAALADKEATDAELDGYRAQEATLLDQIKTERANPGGVVDLRELHDLGETLQLVRAGIAGDVARDAACKAMIADRLKRAKALVAGCR